jgi:hypothetical protein
MDIYGDDLEYADDAPLNAVGGGGSGYSPIFQLLAVEKWGSCFSVSGVCGVCFVTQNKENADHLLFYFKNA